VAGKANTPAMTARKIRDRVIAKAILSNRQRHATGSDGNKGRAEQTGAIVEVPSAGIDRHKKRQGVNGQREDQPAEQAEANGVEEKSKGEHDGGSMCIDVMVAPSTTTAAHGRV
jgi:hypothetical protein